MEIFFTEKFKKEYERLPKDIREKAQKQEKLFKNNIHHPSLNVEKLSPKWKKVIELCLDF